MGDQLVTKQIGRKLKDVPLLGGGAKLGPHLTDVAWVKAYHHRDETCRDFRDPTRPDPTRPVKPAG